MDFLRSELSIADLLYVSDSTVKATVDYDEDVIKRHKYKVRDIIINRIDQTYHAKVVEIQDPKEILKRLREIKINETNVTSMTLRRKLYSMQYNPSKEKASVFIDRFEDVIRAYNNLSEVENLPETKKNDALYSAVVNAVPQILNIEFMSKSTAGKQLTYDNLKLYIMQVESIKVQAATVTTETKTAHLSSMDTVRCYKCDGFGHMSKNCPRLGTRKKMCFECKEFTTHIAANCPQRLQRQRGEHSRYDSTQYKSGSRGSRGGRGRYSGNKRKGDSIESHCDFKRPRPNKNYTQGNRRNWRGHRRGRGKSEFINPKEKANDRGSGNNVETRKYSKSNKQEIYVQNVKPITDTFALHRDGTKSILSRFLVDTGATEYMTKSRLIFKSFNEHPDEIK